MGVGVTMEVFIYAIIIASLMGLSAATAMWVMLKLKGDGSKNVQFIPFGNDWANEEEEIKAAGRVKQPINYDDAPKTAEEHQKRYARDSHSEELRDATR